MTPPFSVRAPGKLLIVGEYAVLDGCPAVVAAVDRGVRCELAARVLEDDGQHDIVTPYDDRFVRPALLRSGAPLGWRYRFTDWNPAQLGVKPGFGGSAAATVAAVAAGLMAAGTDPQALETLALQVHRQVQGSGSGVDVRASVWGGLRRYTADRSPPVPVALSGQPLLTAVWSGRSAQTGPRVTRYLAWSERQSFVQRMQGVLDALQQEPIAALRAAYQLLRHMASAAGVDYDTPAHGHIASLARQHGGAAKPSGAGGGDIAVALIPDPESLSAFHAACLAAGHPPLPVSLSPGVQPSESHSA